MYDHLFVIFFIIDPSSYYSHLWQARYCSQFWTWWVSNCNIWHVSNCPYFLTSYFQSFPFFPSLPKAKTFHYFHFPTFSPSYIPSTRQYVWFMDWVSGKRLASWLPYDLDLSVVFCTKKRSKPAKNGHFCRPAISSLKWGASILLPPICSHHRLLCSTTNTSEKYERQQQGNVLAQ